LAVTLTRLGDFRAAQLHLERVAEGFDAVHDRAGMARTANALGSIRSYRGDYASAVRLYGQAAALARELGDAGLEAVAEANLAKVAFAEGRYEDAEAGVVVALGRAEARGNRRSEGTQHKYLG